jgi:hypothetical protein
MAKISFSREAIAHNIGKGDRASTVPPITVKGWSEAVYGLHIDGPAEVLYRPNEDPSAYIRTKFPVFRLDDTLDSGVPDSELTYIYTRLGFIQHNKKHPDEVPKAPLVGARWVKSRWTKQFPFAMRIHVTGPADVRYSLGSPLKGTGSNKHGVRLWIETRSTVESPCAQLDQSWDD